PTPVEMMRLKTKANVTVCLLLAGAAITVGILLKGPLIVGPFVLGGNGSSDIKWAVGGWVAVGFIAQFFIRCPHCGYRPMTDLLKGEEQEGSRQTIGERCRRCGKAY